MKAHWTVVGPVLLVLATGALGQTDAVVCGGSDRWSIKTSADTSQSVLDAAAAATPKTADDMLNQARPSWSPPKSKYQSKAIPGDEGTTVRVRGVGFYDLAHGQRGRSRNIELSCPTSKLASRLRDFSRVVGHDKTQSPPLMRIGLIGPPFIEIPPRRYGGTELFIANLARELHS